MHVITALVFSLLAHRGTAQEKLSALKPKVLGIPTFRGIIELSHVIPGRIRFRVPAAGQREDAPQLLERGLTRLPHVEHVEVDPRTASVLVTGDKEMDGALVVAGIARLLELEEEIDKPPVSRLNELTERGWRLLDRSLYEATGGLFTFRSAVTLFLMGATVTKVIRERSLSLPPSFTLFWWLYGLTSGTKGGRT